jgi:hypothetical protein
MNGGDPICLNVYRVAIMTCIRYRLQGGILFWFDTQVLFKDPGEVAQVGKPQLVADLGNG